jgi:hypothetical protein
MKTVSKDQKGFAPVEIILVTVIVIALVGLGFYVYHSNKNANKNLNSATNSSNSVSALDNKSTDTADAAGIRAKEAAIGLLGLVKAKDSDFKDYVDKHVNDGTFTTGFKTQVDKGTALAKESDVYCSTIAPAGTVPLTFTVLTSRLAGYYATVNLQAKSGQLTATGPSISLIYANNVWSVDEYSCN